MPLYKFSKQNRSTTIDVSEGKKEDSSDSTFKFDVRSDSPEDSAKTVEIIKNTIALVLSGNPRVSGNIVEWSGQSSLNASQLMSTIRMNLESSGYIPGKEARPSRFRSIFSRHKSKRLSLDQPSIN